MDSRQPRSYLSVASLGAPVAVDVLGQDRFAQVRLRCVDMDCLDRSSIGSAAILDDARRNHVETTPDLEATNDEFAVIASYPSIGY